MSVKEKPRQKIAEGEDQGDERKRTADEVSKVYEGIKTGVLAEFQDKLRGNLFTA